MDIEQYLQLARTAMQEDNAEDVVRFYDFVRTEDPTNYEAKFFYAYYKIFNSKKIEVPNFYRTFIKVVGPSITLLKNSKTSIEEQTKFLATIDSKIYNLINSIICAKIIGYNCWGDNLDLLENYAKALEENFSEVKEVSEFIVNAWKKIYLDTNADIFARVFEAKRALAKAKLQIYCPDFLAQQEKEETKRNAERQEEENKRKAQREEDERRRKEEENKIVERVELRRSAESGNKTIVEYIAIINKALSLDEQSIVDTAIKKAASRFTPTSVKEVLDSDLSKEIKLKICRSVSTVYCPMLKAFNIGDEFEKNQDFDKEFINLALKFWKEGVSWQRKNCFDKVAITNRKLVKDYVEKIKKYEPNYEIPKLRGCITIG